MADQKPQSSEELEKTHGVHGSGNQDEETYVDHTVEASGNNEKSCISSTLEEEKQNYKAGKSEIPQDNIQSTSKTEVTEASGKKEGEQEMETGSEETGEHQSGADDRFSYLTDRGYTSEIFKVEIYNLPNYTSYSNLKKRLVTSLGLKPCKIKIPNAATYAFVNFKCEEDREKALSVVPGHVWKSKELKIKKADPAKDPMAQKRKQDSGEIPPASKVAKLDLEEPDIPVEERLNLAVTPLYKMPYEEQLQMKTSTIKDFMKKLGQNIERANRENRTWLQEQKKAHDGLCCQLHSIKPSPVTEAYRNKCEFTIGRSESGKEILVGFRLGRYKGGSVSVASVSSCIHIPQQMKDVTKALENYLQKSAYTSFDPEIGQGHWRQLTLRVTLAGDVMAAILFHPNKLSEDEVNKEKESVKDYFTQGEGKTCNLTSLYFQVQESRAGTERNEQLLSGKQYILEDLLGMKFQISPSSFFQVNTLAAEVLYSQIAEWCDVSENTAVLDVCCGTGSIGLTMTKHRSYSQNIKKIIGIEMCKEAIEDAKINAQLNNIESAEFHCGKAEDVLPSLIGQLRGMNVVAVVDPPRGGLHSNVVRTLRKSVFVKKLIYVSCNPNGALANIVSLTQSQSNKYKGPAFNVMEAIPVDLFPHTDHCELVLRLARD